MRHPLRSLRTVSLGLVGAGLLAASSQAQLVEQAPLRLLDALELTGGTVQRLVLPWTDQQPFETRVWIAGELRQLWLEPYDMRSEDFRLVSMDADGLRELEAPAPTTYRGTVEGAPGSVVAANLFNGQLTGLVRLDGVLWAIQPATEGFAWLPRAAHVVYHEGQVQAKGYVCGSDHGPSVGGAPGPDAAGVAEVAAELHPRFRQIWGGIAPSVNQASAILNGVDAIYQNDTNVSYSIGLLLTREGGYPSNTTSVLNQMTNAWNTRAGEIRRDMAHLFTGNPSSGVIGVAWLSSVCGSQQYSVSWHTSSLVTRVAVTAHEFGHSWSAGHCNGAAQCFIMCSSINGCNSNITQFAPVSVNQINNFAATRTCLN